MGKKSKKKQKITVKEEEIDLVKLFSLIGNAFSRFFNFIGKLLKEVFHYLIISLLFIKQNLFKVMIPVFLGALIGFFLDFHSKPLYTYDMIIEPNYSSVNQIFEKLEYYNVLISEGDSIKLSEEFNISYQSANDLSEFTLSPYESDKDRILAYNDFLKETDSLTHKYFNFEDFKGKGTSKLDSKLYVYRINSHQLNLKSLEEKIILDIEENKTLQKRRSIKLNILKLDSEATYKAIEEANLLRDFYKEVRIQEVKSDKTLSSTYIDFSKESKSNNDIELFEISKSLNENLIKIELKKETSENIVNVITHFNPVGAKVGKFYETNMFVMGRNLGAFALVILLLLNLNRYLIKFKQEN